MLALEVTVCKGKVWYRFEKVYMPLTQIDLIWKLFRRLNATANLNELAATLMRQPEN